jgi:hypothetical protein
MVITNILLLHVRNLSDRYQEQKYVALASLNICELLLLGEDSAAARYTVITGVIFLTDTVYYHSFLYQKLNFRMKAFQKGCL